MRFYVNAAAATGLLIGIGIFANYLWLRWRSSRNLLKLAAFTCAIIWAIAAALIAAAWLVAAAEGLTEYGRFVQNVVTPVARISAAACLILTVVYRHQELRQTYEEVEWLRRRVAGK